jgi:hypothetical protein
MESFCSTGVNVPTCATVTLPAAINFTISSKLLREKSESANPVFEVRDVITFPYLFTPNFVTGLQQRTGIEHLEEKYLASANGRESDDVSLSKLYLDNNRPQSFAAGQPS